MFIKDPTHTHTYTWEACQCGKSRSLHCRVGRCCVCTLTLTVQDRPRHPPFLSTRWIRRNTLADSFYADRTPLTFVFACRIKLFFFPFLFATQRSIHDLSIMMLRARVNAFISSTRYNFAARYYPNIRIRRGTNLPYGAIVTEKNVQTVRESWLCEIIIMPKSRSNNSKSEHTKKL